MIAGIDDFKNVFFIGVAGTGMSAIAQYLAGIGKEVSGSDRYFLPGCSSDTKEKLRQPVSLFSAKWRRHNSGYRSGGGFHCSGRYRGQKCKKQSNWAFPLLKDLNCWR